jgi:hypothetical protein
MRLQRQTSFAVRDALAGLGQGMVGGLAEEHLLEVSVHTTRPMRLADGRG